MTPPVHEPAPGRQAANSQHWAAPYCAAVISVTARV